MVYPLLDAAHSRWFYFSSACRPFGLVSLFPDTKTAGDWGNGYCYGTDTIKDFSHVHEWQLSGVAVMPVTFTETSIAGISTNYASPFSHKTEIIRPGYHSVTLDRYQIKAELTATNRTGFHRYHFPGTQRRAVLFELGGHLGPSDIIEGGFVVVGNREVRGYTLTGRTGRRPKNYPVFFNARFNQPIKKIYLYENGVVKEGLNKWRGSNGKILVELEQSGEPVLMKVGVSFTSEAGAANNLLKEIPDWNFGRVADDAKRQWNEMLGRIQIEGGTLTQQKRFYTDLWHAISGRRMISDIDGKYSDCTGLERKIRQVPLFAGKPKFNMYNSDAFWGAQWTINTLWQLVYPEVAEEFCNSFVEYYKNGGLIPRGPAAGNYTFVMTGASSTPFFVSAWQKGIRGFDMNVAYEGLRKNHMPGGMMSHAGYEHKTTKGGGLEYYISRGYVPYPLSDTVYGMHQDGAAMTLEYAYQDWCLAQLSRALSKEDDYQYFLKRSANFQNLFDTTRGYMVPKDKDGAWQTDYDPLSYDSGFEEGNGAYYSWFVPHNLSRLFSLMGGREAVINKLNDQFSQSQQYRFCNEHPEQENRFVNNKRTWINYSNQPAIETAFVFNYAGAPWLTQYWSRLVVDSVYSGLSPYSGYSGDEDQGLMGSLSVLMKIGLFQMAGGCEADPKYEIGSPIFSRISFELNPKYFRAKRFTIIAENVSDNNRYIQSATINNKPLDHFYFRQSDMNAGGALRLMMGSEPNKGWGLVEDYY